MKHVVAMEEPYLRLIRLMAEIDESVHYWRGQEVSSCCGTVVKL